MRGMCREAWTVTYDAALKDVALPLLHVVGPVGARYLRAGLTVLLALVAAAVRLADNRVSADLGVRRARLVAAPQWATPVFQGLVATWVQRQVLDRALLGLALRRTDAGGTRRVGLEDQNAGWLAHEDHVVCVC